MALFRLLVLGLLVEALLMKAECSIMRKRSKLLQKDLTHKYKELIFIALMKGHPSFLLIKEQPRILRLL